MNLLTGAILLTLSSLLLSAQPAVNLGRVLDSKSLHIVAFGDFGTGSESQMAIARAIARQHSQQAFDFGITLGDNFYRCGVHSIEDPKWNRFWEKPYGGLGIPFYAALGNHDYGRPPAICPGLAGSPDVEVEYTKHSKSWRMPARYYTYRAGPALFIAIDTEGWTGDQLKWVEDTLKESANDRGIQWRIVYGHHPMYTSGVHLNQRRISVLRDQLQPVFEAAKVDLYICGHDHDLEHLRKGGVEFLIAGGGGAQLRKPRRKDPASVFVVAKHAFLDLQIDAEGSGKPRQLTAKYLDENLQPVERLSLQIRK